MDILRATDLIGSSPRPGQQAAIAGGVAQLSRALTRVICLVWALTMSVAGGLMMLGASEAGPWLRTPLLCAGCTGIISGVLEFRSESGAPIVCAGRRSPS